MFPDQQNQPGAQPAQSAQPYQPPQTGVNSAPVAGTNGQYQSVPSLPTANNTGHSGHNPYEFIFNPNQPKRAGKLGGDKFLMKIAIIAGGAVLLMIAAAIVISLLFPSKSSTADLTRIAQQQQELVRVASMGPQASTQSAKNFAASVQLSMASSQNQIITYLGQHGAKVDKKMLALGQSAETDQILAAAKSTSTFDTALQQTLNDQLVSYQTSLKTAYDNASDKQLEALLKQHYAATTLLLDEAKAAQ